jgi:leukotriene-A4 hydrolase
VLWLCGENEYLTGARFLAKEEDIVGPYKFGVYDVLVLPPSFPYGGMVSLAEPPILATSVDARVKENACLSFLTPSAYKSHIHTANA